MDKCDVVSRVIISKKLKCSDTVVGLDTGLVVNWSAVFFETVFESSFGFTYVFIWSSGCIASCK